MSDVTDDGSVTSSQACGKPAGMRGASACRD
ncbi:hypothetical protein NBEOAGPD_4888 [Methylobacterium gregans]|uniref:Uncharacterized protein n=1 Tax=Methylobacterium gregans TaxID=374424 RepID=A0AA37HTB7_9HYPH|nr:hypothetical protein [Methylobacterium gregans]GJD81634.1 hypothetical protein NBEOAGPD_4888 [Methylobacterium gregans]